MTAREEKVKEADKEEGAGTDRPVAAVAAVAAVAVAVAAAAAAVIAAAVSSACTPNREGCD